MADEDEVVGAKSVSPNITTSKPLDHEQLNNAEVSTDDSLQKKLSVKRVNTQTLCYDPLLTSNRFNGLLFCEGPVFVKVEKNHEI